MRVCVSVFLCGVFYFRKCLYVVAFCVPNIASQDSHFSHSQFQCITLRNSPHLAENKLERKTTTTAAPASKHIQNTRSQRTTA